MLQLARNFFAPMLSLFLLSISTAILTTVQSVWLYKAHYSSFVVGLTVAAYYTGFVYAAFRTERLILRVSHIRAFASFSACLCALIILQGLVKDPWSWSIIRLFAGYCSAGLFIVVESWLLSQSTPKIRGSVLALYMVVFYVAQSLGQLFLNFGLDDVLRIFAISAIAMSLSIIPLALTKLPQPTIEEPSTLNFFKLFKESPTGVIGSLISGMVLGPIYGLMPVYFTYQHQNTHEIAFSMFIMILGGMAFQIPFGKLSDRIDRRLVLILVFLIQLVALAALYFNVGNFYYLTYFIFGGACFAIYPISISHACDVLDVKDMVAAAQGLVMINSVGMALGPVLASLAMWLLTEKIGLLGYFALITVLMVLFYTWRQFAGNTVADEHQQDFVAMPRATPVTVEIDPRIDNDE